MTGFYHCDKYPKCGCSPVESCHPMKEAHIDARQPRGEDIERRKQEEADQWSLPYPQPANRAQRRVNERAREKREREKENQLAAYSGPWKKDWKKSQKRKGGAKRMKR